MFQIFNYNKLTNFQKIIFFDFLKKTHEEVDKKASVNMWNENWPSRPETLPYILEKTNRFKSNGSFNILFNNNEIVGCSGVYKSDFCNEIAIAGTRTWINKKYRNKSISREILLPYEKKWAINRNFKAIILTFNEYNKNLIHLWNKRRLGEQRTTRDVRHFGYNGVELIPYPVNIQYTKQFVICEKLDKNWHYDWSLLQIS